MQAMTRSELLVFLQSPTADEIIEDDEPLYLVRADALLYPQYDVHNDVRRFAALDQVRKWLGKRAHEELMQDHGALHVREHWKMLVSKSYEGGLNKI